MQEQRHRYTVACSAVARCPAAGLPVPLQPHLLLQLLGVPAPLPRCLPASSSQLPLFHVHDVHDFCFWIQTYFWPRHRMSCHYHRCQVHEVIPAICCASARFSAALSLPPPLVQQELQAQWQPSAVSPGLLLLPPCLLALHCRHWYCRYWRCRHCTAGAALPSTGTGTAGTGTAKHWHGRHWHGRHWHGRHWHG